MSEIARLREALAALEAQRQILGDEVVDAAVAPMREKLAALAAIATPEQRKLVTIVFADLAGFTALTAGHDSEDVREMVNAYFTRWTAAIEAHGGMVEKFIGDAVMAVFGMARAFEDDAERAVRSALAMRDSLAELNAELAGQGRPSLAMRVGIATGPVVVSFFGERRGTDVVAVGDAVNLASRLQGLGPEGGILISHDTYRQVRGMFDLEALAPLKVKGIDDPITAYLVLRAKPRSFRLEPYRVEDVETRMVGREAEFDGVRDAIEAALENGSRAMVTILGEAGLGKSRLLYETENWLDLRPERILRFAGRATPGTTAHPYSLLRDVLMERLEVPDTAPRGMPEDRLAGAFEAADGWDTDVVTPMDAGVRAAYVARLIGLEPVGPIDATDPRELHDRAVSYLLSYFDSMASGGPVAILLEDLHWADDGSLDFLKRMMRSTKPGSVVVLATARPALLDRRPHWAEGEDFHSGVQLLPLTRSAGRRLLDDILQKVADVPADLRDLVVGNAEGNPYYIEEIVRKLIDDDVIVLGEDEWSVESGALIRFAVPGTLVGLLQSRLDALPSEERLALERAGVIGKIFWDRAVEALHDGEAALPVRALLESLRDRELVLRSERSAFEGAAEYTFKHALLRDVTYEAILKRTRKRYHALAARWLVDTTATTGRQDEHAGLIAQHLERAGDPAACDWYRKASDAATAQFANRESLFFSDKALELVGPDDPTRFEILWSRRDVVRAVGDRSRLNSDTAELAAAAERSGGSVDLARAGMARAGVFVMGGEHANAQAAVEAAVEHARRSGDVPLLADALVMAGEVQWRRGDLVGARAWAGEGKTVAADAGLVVNEASLERLEGLMAEMEGRPREALDRYAAALDKFQNAGHRRAVARVLNDMGTASAHLGEYARAKEYLERSLRLRDLMGDVAGEEVVRNNLGIVAVGEADLEWARREYESALAISVELDSPEGIASAYQGLGAIALRLGQLEEAKRMTDLALARYVEMEDEQGRAQALIDRAWTELFAGNPVDAEATASLAVGVATAGEFAPESSLANLVRGRALLELGKHAEAAEALGVAAADETAEGGPAVRTMGSVGLAVALLPTDRAKARAALNDVLDFLEVGSVRPLPDPLWAYLGAHQVLIAVDDNATAAVGEWGRRLLDSIVDRLQDAANKESLLAGVPSNRRLPVLEAG